ncbi:hypothetical protein OSTOST_25367, partial [Ostertagia ostertagi]
MKKRLDEAVNNISIMDVFVKKWMLDIPFINRWWKPLLEPTYAFKEFLKKQVEESADAEIGGYAVPKHTIVSAELSLILSDEAIFPNSKEFDPSRYLDDPSLLTYVVPFGLGRRSCLGESLARAELYL